MPAALCKAPANQVFFQHGKKFADFQLDESPLSTKCIDRRKAKCSLLTQIQTEQLTSILLHARHTKSI